MTLDDFDRAVYAHLAGYAAIAVVLASSSWVSPIGQLVGYTFGLGVAVTLLVEVPAALQADGDDVVATDGGESSGDGGDA